MYYASIVDRLVRIKDLKNASVIIKMRRIKTKGFKMVKLNIVTNLHP